MVERGHTRLDAIQVLRAIACVMVAISHASATKNGMFGEDPLGIRILLRLGVYGVELFFLISGFIIIFVHHRDIGVPSALAPYAQKRLIRIFAPYWPIGIPIAVAFATVMSDRMGVWNWASSILLYPDPIKPALAVGWSLEHELIFYAIFGCLILNRMLGVTVVALWSIGLIINAIFSFSTDSRLLADINILFLAGVAVFYGRKLLHPRTFLAIAAIILIIGLGLAAQRLHTIFSQEDYRAAFLLIDSGAMFFLVLTGIFALTVSQNFVLKGPWRAVLLVGDASYSIYLVHTIFIFVFAIVWAKVGIIPPALFTVSAVLGSILSGVVVHKVMEKPLIRWINRKLAARRKISSQ